MSWEGFWLPNIIQATVFSILAAVVGFLARRWIRQAFDWLGPAIEQIFGEQQRTKHAAESAATRAGEAAKSAGSASESASSANDNSRQANDALEWFMGEIARRDAAEREMKERIDRLLGTRARSLATERVDDIPTGLIIPISAAEDDDPATVTGRHRLHTQHIQAIDEGDPA